MPWPVRPVYTLQVEGRSSWDFLPALPCGWTTMHYVDYWAVVDTGAVVCAEKPQLGHGAML